MSIKNIEIQDENGNIHYPHTSADVVWKGDKSLSYVVDYNDKNVKLLIETEKTERKEELKTELKKIIKPKTNIVCCGDSTMAGGQPTKLVSINKWLGFRLGRNVINTGVWGWRIDYLIEPGNFNDKILKYNPSHCIMLCGANNISDGDSIPTILEYFKIFINLCKENQIEPILCGTLNRNDNINLRLPTIELNYALSDYCKNVGVYFVDTYNGSSNVLGDINLSMFWDGLHLTPYGSYEIAKQIFETTKNTLNKTDVKFKLPRGNEDLFFKNANMSVIENNFPKSWSRYGIGFSNQHFSIESNAGIDGGNLLRFTVPKGFKEESIGVQSYCILSDSQFIVGKSYRISFDYSLHCNAEKVAIRSTIFGVNGADNRINEQNILDSGDMTYLSNSSVFIDYTIQPSTVGLYFELLFGSSKTDDNGFVATFSNFNVRNIDL